MDCRLDILVHYLTSESFDQELIDEVIVKYYKDRDNRDYEIKGSLYEITTEQERNQKIYDVAEERYYDVVADMESKLSKRDYLDNFNSDIYISLINSIPEELGIDAIIETMNYEEEFECNEVWVSYPYTIHRIN